MSNMITRYNPFEMDPFFNEFFRDESNSHLLKAMKTDVKDNGTNYEMKVELPEIKRENINVSLEDGYLIISAVTNSDDDKSHGHYVRKERYYGSYKRSFYVGDTVKEEDIKAKLNDGVLTLIIPKVEEKKPEKKYIAIE